MVSRRDVLTAFGALCAAPLNAYASAVEAKRSAERALSGNERVKPDFDANGNVLDRWWGSLPVNRWLEVVDTDFISHVTPLLPKGFRDFGTIGLKGVFHAWCGAAFDRAGGRMFFFGGGHKDSSNNGLYEFGLRTMRWRVAMSPSILTPEDIEHSRKSWNDSPRAWVSYTQGYEYPNDYWRDGKPTATHTYRALCYRPTAREAIVNVFKHLWGINVDTGVSRILSSAPWMSESSLFIDEETHRGFLFRIDHDTYRSYRIFDFAKGTLSALNNCKARTDKQAPFKIGRRAYFVHMDSPAWLDLDTLQSGEFGMRAPFQLYAGTGEYSDRMGKFYAMNRPSGSAVYGSFSAFDPSTGTWEQYAPEGTLPPPKGANEPYSKFRIFERDNGVFMVLFHVAHENLRICRLA